MELYILIGLGLWVAFILSIVNSRYYIALFAICIVIFVGLAGLRWETGYDWMYYEKSFADVPRLFDLGKITLPASLAYKGPLFTLLLSVIRTCHGNLQVLFLVVALFNGMTFYIFTNYCKVNSVFVFAMYFCWAYLYAQMGVMRDSIAISFFLLTLIEFEKGNALKAIILFAIGVLFHPTILLFSLVFFISLYEKLIEFKIYLIVIMAIIFIFSNGIFELLPIIGRVVPISSIVYKLNYYYALGPATKTPAAIGYFIFNILLFVYLSNNAFITRRLDKVLMLSIFTLIATEALFWQIPLLWRRVNIFVVISQAIMLCRTWPAIRPTHKAFQFATISILSMVALVRSISGLSGLPFRPYQSVIRFAFPYAEPGDGRQRFKDYEHATEPRLPEPYIR